jgi:2-polyprenyl-3-methyl-5-hydroxy-6-metoxy-1,4-benzoquinol methylase
MAKRRVAEFFNHYAEGFDRVAGAGASMHTTLVNRWFRRSMTLRFERAMLGCEPIAGCTVLDIGCGPGHYGIALARAGASKVVGIDFAEKMITLARKRVTALGLEQVCRFEAFDFLQFPTGEQFDYAIAMGFMDYVAEPDPVIERAVTIARRKAMFSFPINSGFLAWQRQIRYRHKCDLFMYSHGQLERLFARWSGRVKIEPIGRDFFVTVDKGTA